MPKSVRYRNRAVLRTAVLAFAVGLALFSGIALATLARTPPAPGQPPADTR